MNVGPLCSHIQNISRGAPGGQAAYSLPQAVLAMKTGARGGKAGHAARAAAGEGA
jgi:hypothetical protein